MNKRMHSLILHSLFAATLAALAPSQSLTAQQADAQFAARAPQPVVPQMMRYSGVATTRAGDSVEAVFRIYSTPQGGEPIWSETQSIRIGADGKYSVLLGASTQGGLPDAVFQGGQGRWLGVSIERAPESGRSVLASVAYAMKAADAESLAGRNAADFVTQEQLRTKLASAQAATANIVHPDATLTGAGTANTIPLWTSASNFGNSIMTQSGTKIGINTAAPATTLDVTGTTALRGNTTIAPTTVATAAAGVNSPVLGITASSFKSGAAAVNQNFGWEVQATANNTANPGGQVSLLYSSGAAGWANSGLFFTSAGSIYSTANLTVSAGLATPSTAGSSPKIVMEASSYNSTLAKSVPQNYAFSAFPAGNNTPSPTANLDLEFSSGSAAPVPTGLSFSPTGIVNFAPGQTFPGTGDITGVTATSPLTGGGTSGSVNVALNESTLVSDIAPSMATTLESAYDSRYAQLAVSNSFAPTQFFQQDVDASGTVQGNLLNSVTGYALAGSMFDSGLPGLNDAFLGFAVSPNATGTWDVSVGPVSMLALTSGFDNTGVGSYALKADMDGYDNTAVGYNSLENLVGGCGQNPPPPPQFKPGQTFALTNSMRGAHVRVHSNDACQNPEGWGDTAVGTGAGQNDQNGITNTYVGYLAGPDSSSTGLTGATAIGANATVSQNYSVVLGQTTTTPGQLNASVGIGTATPTSALDIVVLASGNLGPTITLTNPSGAGGASSSLDFYTTVPDPGSVFITPNPGARIVAEDTNYSDNLSFYSNTPGSKNNGLRKNLELFAGGGGELFGALTTTGPIVVTGNSTITGNLHVTGTLSKGLGSFKIDHPLDPANKYLSHSFVESPDMMNIYNGLITLDSHGRATIQMPDWFEALNSDFRYQLTAVGAPGPNLYVAEEINGNHFRIAGGKPGMKVSWQVTGIRQDALANAHRIPVEEDKPANERGYYLNPEVFGAGQDRSVFNAPKE